MPAFNLTQPALIAQTSTQEQSNTWIILSNGELVRVPLDADPDAFRKYAEAKIRLQANPKPRHKTHSRADNGCKRKRQARLVFTGDIVGRATARRMDELAAIADEDTFVSGPEWDAPIPFDGSPVPYEVEQHPRFEYAVQEGW